MKRINYGCYVCSTEFATLLTLQECFYAVAAPLSVTCLLACPNLFPLPHSFIHSFSIFLSYFINFLILFSLSDDPQCPSHNSFLALFILNMAAYEDEYCGCHVSLPVFLYSPTPCCESRRCPAFSLSVDPSMKSTLTPVG